MNIHLSDIVSAFEKADSESEAKGYGLLLQLRKDLIDQPIMCVELIDAAKDGHLSDGQLSVLTAVLEEARMAHENGQRKGNDFLVHMQEAVGLLGTNLSPPGALSLSRAWTRAGLTPPAELAFAVIAHNDDAFADTDGIPDIPDIPDEMFDGIFKGFNEIGEESVSAMLSMLNEMLATLPPEARFAFVRKLGTRPERLCGEATAAMLLSKDPSAQEGALAGLTLRQQEGNLSKALFSRITLIRSWLNDEPIQKGIDRIVRLALKNGTQQTVAGLRPKIHRVITSLVDGSGAQSITVAVQTGSRRFLAFILIKQGFGVKDSFVLPCSNAREQKEKIAMIADQAGGIDVTPEYVLTALSWALADGQSNDTAPALGLFDVMETAGFDLVRPQHADIRDIADPDQQMANLSVSARGRLITASAHWPNHFEISNSWYEDSDATSDAIESARTPSAVDRQVWQHLEERRDFWVMVFARNAALLAAANNPTAIEFSAVACALHEGRDLKKTPIMTFVHAVSIEAWTPRNKGPLG